jgi:hypothetical protein
VHARGPFGVPDPNDPAGLKLLSGFPYGAVVPLPIRVRDAEFFDTLAPIGFLVDDVEVKAFAGFGVDSQTCKDAYAAAKGNPARTAAFKRGQLERGQSWLVGLVGCQGASSKPECAGGNNARVVSKMVDLAPPSSYAGAGDAKLAIQIANLAEFGGYQDADLYLQPMQGGDAGPDGAPILLAGPLSAGDVAERAAGVQIANAKLAVLLVVKHGTAPFCGGQAPCPTTIPLPIQPFVDKYAPVTGAAWSGNQVFALFGRPPLDASEKPQDVVRLGVFAASF